MAILHKKKSQTCSMGCITVKWLLGALLLLAAVASLVGMYYTHVFFGTDPVDFRMQFGSTSGSLAIIAFAISSSAFLKQMLACMGPCEVCSR